MKTAADCCQSPLCKSAWLHLLLLFIFCAYLFLGACGLYFLLLPAEMDEEDDSIDLMTVPSSPLDNNGQSNDDDYQMDSGFIEISADVQGTNVPIQDEQMEHRRLQQVKREHFKSLDFGWTLLVSFNWMTTTGNRWPGEWETPDSGLNNTRQWRDFTKGNRVWLGKLYAAIFTILGAPIWLLILIVCSGSVLNAVNGVCYWARRRLHLNMYFRKTRDWNEQRRRDAEHSRFWNPFWLLVLLAIYVWSGAAIFRRIWRQEPESDQLSFAECFWNCFALVAFLGETSRLLVLPRRHHNVFVQILYASMGMILFASFLRAFLPLAEKFRRSDTDQYPRRESRDVDLEPEIDRLRPNRRRFWKWTLARPGQQQRSKVGKRVVNEYVPVKAAPPVSFSPKSILRQRNGAFSFDIRNGPEEERLIRAPVAVVSPAPTGSNLAPKEGEVTLRFKPQRQPLTSAADQIDSASSPIKAAGRPKPAPYYRPPLPPTLPVNARSPADADGNLLMFSICPDSIPYADERASVLL